MSEVSNKRFVHFNGTKEDFITGGYPSTYTDSIVFINGDGNESNNTIYTHGEYYGQGVIVEGDASNSAVLKGEYENYNNKAISQVSVSIGAGSTAGLKGWYYSGIDFTNKKIYLSKTQPNSIKTSGFTTDTSITIEMIQGPKEGTILKKRKHYLEGHKISIVCNSKYENCSTIKNVENGVITVDEFPFTSDEIPSYVLGIGKDPDEFTLYSINVEIDSTTKVMNVYGYKQGGVDLGGGSLAEGVNSYALNVGAHAEGVQTVAQGQYSHTEGFRTTAVYASHAEGRETKANAQMSHTEGAKTITNGKYSHAEGNGSITIGESSHAEGESTISFGKASHAEGQGVPNNGEISNPLGSYYYCGAAGEKSHTEGTRTNAGAVDANGKRTIDANSAHAEGFETQATANRAHAEGTYTIASGNSSHSEGRLTHAKGYASHAEGGSDTSDFLNATVAEGNYSHAEGQSTYAKGIGAHTEGICTITNNNGEHASGKYNKSDSNTLFSVGFGVSEQERKNAFEIQHSGNIIIPNIKDSGTFDVLQDNIILVSGDGTNSIMSKQSGNIARQIGSVAIGSNLLSTGLYSYAEGQGKAIDASGNRTIEHELGVYQYVGASADKAHVEGTRTNATSNSAHAEGFETQATANRAHAEGTQTLASGHSSHAEGRHNIASGDFSHAEGELNIASGKHSHSEGYKTQATSYYSHSEGYDTLSSGNTSHTEGRFNTTKGPSSHTEGLYNSIDDNAMGSHVEGGAADLIAFSKIKLTSTEDSVVYKYNLGSNTTYPSINKYQPLVGTSTIRGIYIKNVDTNNKTITLSETLGECADTEYRFGNRTTKSASHVEGSKNYSDSHGGHIEGFCNVAKSGNAIHVEGMCNTGTGTCSHVGGFCCTASHENSFVHGECLVTSQKNQFVIGQYNKTSENSLFVVGNGTNSSKQNNVFDITSDGNVYINDKLLNTSILKYSTPIEVSDDGSECVIDPFVYCVVTNYNRSYVFTLNDNINNYKGNSVDVLMWSCLIPANNVNSFSFVSYSGKPIYYQFGINPNTYTNGYEYIECCFIKSSKDAPILCTTTPYKSI